MRRCTYICLTLLMFSLSCLSQSLNIRGHVLSDQGKPVPYASLGIKSKSIGTVADEKGRFDFSVPEEEIYAEDTLVISCIGFADTAIAISRFRHGRQEIILRTVTEQLEDVVVQPGKTKERKVGRARGLSLAHINFYVASDTAAHDRLGREHGVILSLKHGSFLKDFNFYVSGNQFQSMTFRLNIWAVEQDRPVRSLLNKDIIFKVVGQKRGWVKVDLSSYNIFLKNPDKIAVSLQWLESEKAHAESRYFAISAGTPSAFNGHIFRDKSQDHWKVNKEVNPSMYLTVNYYLDTI